MRKTAFIIPVVLLAGCTTFGGPDSKEVKPTSASAIDQSIADAARDAADALKSMAEVERSRAGVSAGTGKGALPSELQRTTNVSWIGPAAALLGELAGKLGYEFKSYGKDVPALSIVSIERKQMQIADILKEVGVQLGDRAKVVVNPSRKLIEIHYAS